VSGWQAGPVLTASESSDIRGPLRHWLPGHRVGVPVGITLQLQETSHRHRDRGRLGWAKLAANFIAMHEVFDYVCTLYLTQFPVKTPGNKDLGLNSVGCTAGHDISAGWVQLLLWSTFLEYSGKFILSKYRSPVILVSYHICIVFLEYSTDDCCWRWLHFSSFMCAIHRDMWEML
jgi:hypothetical protein